MRRVTQIIASAAALLTVSPSIAASAGAQSREASIPFVGMRSIEDWRADGDGALYVQDIHRKWYHATLMGPCIDLPFTETIGIETRGIDTLDKYGTILVRHERCAIKSFVESGPPPKKIKPHKKG